MNKDIYIIAFCNNVKRIRESKGLSKQEMAKKARYRNKKLIHDRKRDFT